MCYFSTVAFWGARHKWQDAVLFCTLLCAISPNGSTQPIKKQRTKGLPNPFSLLRARVRAHTHIAEKDHRKERYYLLKYCLKGCVCNLLSAFCKCLGLIGDEVSKRGNHCVFVPSVIPLWST